MSTSAAKAKQAEDGATAVMPEELKAKGWKLEQRTINDDQTVFIAGNEDLALSTRKDTAEDAIVEAVILQAREDSETLMTDEARVRLAEMRDREAAPPAQSAAANDIGGFRPSPEASPLHQAQIRLDGGTQPRAELDTALVAQYAEAMAEGYLFPPVTVYHDGKAYWLADGFHRFFAYKKFLEAHHPHRERILQAEIIAGTKRDAILFSLGANDTHGLPRSNDDKRRAVLRLLEDKEWKQWSDSAIAEAAHVSQPFVSAIRREIDKPAEASPTPFRQKIEKSAGTTDLKRFESTGTKKIGKDKIARETAKIGKVKIAGSRQPARTDIDVDEATAPRAASASANNDSLAIDAPVIINLAIKPGKNPKRGITISGRAGEGKPIFLSQFTFADLQPMPPAIFNLMGSLAKSAARSAAAKSAAKPKPKAKARKK